MSDRIKKIKIKQSDGTFSDYIPIGANAKDIDLEDGDNVENKIKNINNRLDDYINVKLFGAKGDGVTDDYNSIQDCINNHPGKTIYFPDGTYIISEHISTSAIETEKNYLLLSKKAIIKASDNFSDIWLIEIGDRGTGGGYSDSFYHTGVEGGTLDCNGRCSGLHSVNTHMARFTDINIVNATIIGMQIDKANNSSSDTYVDRIYVHGIDANNIESIGFLITGNDNMFSNCRTTGFCTGMKLIGGGNYLYSCHPLVGVTENFDSSIGFHIKSNDNTLTNCYSDNFATGVLQDGNYRCFIRDFFCYWYSNTDNLHACFRVSGQTKLFKLIVDGLHVTWPSNGSNYGILPELGYPISNFSRGGNLVSGSITNYDLDDADFNNLTDKYSDLIMNSNILGNKSSFLGNSKEYIENKWYPILFIASDRDDPYMNLNIQLGKHINFNLGLYIDNNKYRITSMRMNQQSDSIFTNGFELAIGKAPIITTDQTTQSFIDNNSYYILYIKFNNTGTQSIIIKGKETGIFSSYQIFTRDMANNEIFNGVDTIPNKLSSLYGESDFKVDDIQNGTVMEWRNTGDYKTEHTIQYYSGKESVGFIIVHWSNSDAVYLFTATKLIPIYENITDPDEIEKTIDNENRTINITLSNTGIVSYMFF